MVRSWPDGLDQRVAGALRLEVVARLGQRQAGRLAQPLDHHAARSPAACSRRCRPRCRPAAAPPASAGCTAAARCRSRTCARVPGELLTEGDRRGVHQMGTAGFDHLGPTRRPCAPARTARWSSAGIRSAVTASAAARWIDDGNTSLLDCEALTWSLGCTGRPQLAGGERGDHLVGVHVRRRAGSGLEDVDRELVVVAGRPRPAPRPRRDRLGQILVENAELGVDLRRGPLDLGQRPDVRRLQATPGDREVLHGPLRLGPPQRVRRDPDLAHRVAFDAVATVVGSHVSIALRRGRVRSRSTGASWTTRRPGTYRPESLHPPTNRIDLMRRALLAVALGGVLVTGTACDHRPAGQRSRVPSRARTVHRRHAAQRGAGLLGGHQGGLRPAGNGLQRRSRGLPRPDGQDDRATRRPSSRRRPPRRRRRPVPSSGRSARRSAETAAAAGPAVARMPARCRPRRSTKSAHATRRSSSKIKTQKDYDRLIEDQLQAVVHARRRGYCACQRSDRAPASTPAS